MTRSVLVSQRAGSHGDNLEVDARCRGEGHEVVRVRGQDLVAVVSEEHAGAAPQVLVQGGHFDALEQSRDPGLPPRPASPDLADHATVAHRGPAGEAFSRAGPSRTTIARPRARRVASRIPSAVLAPCSAS